jgi:hypothetical protein
LRHHVAYSILLYMKTRVTFRVAADLADALRVLPNQTSFVEAALRSALGRTCPSCEGSGRIPWNSVVVSDFRRAELPRLDRSHAVQLQGLVRLARKLAASRLDLARGREAADLEFVLRRGESVLMRGVVSKDSASVRPNEERPS